MFIIIIIIGVLTAEKNQNNSNNNRFPLCVAKVLPYHTKNGILITMIYNDIWCINDGSITQNNSNDGTTHFQLMWLLIGPIFRIYTILRNIAHTDNMLIWNAQTNIISFYNVFCIDFYDVRHADSRITQMNIEYIVNIYMNI